MHTNLIVQHNISFLTAEHLLPLYAPMFPDSKIAKKFKCSWTKTASIPKLSNDASSKVFPVGHYGRTTLLNDATISNTGLKRMKALCCQIFDVDTSKWVECQFYNMRGTSGEHCSKASTLFQAINGWTLTKDGLDWDNIVSVGLGNTYANIGNKNSIKSITIEKNGSCFIAGCNCHLLHLSAGRGGSAYSAVSGSDCQDHQVDLYYFFHSSTRHKGILTEYPELVELEWENIVRYVQTRWLSSEYCCNKELKKRPALKSLFLNGAEKEVRSSIKEQVKQMGQAKRLQLSSNAYKTLTKTP